MPEQTIVMAFDIGTTGAKTCLYRIGREMTLLDSDLVDYPLIRTPDGGAEQRVEDWWTAMCRGSRAVLSRSNISAEQVRAISFCCQMQALVLVDRDGNAVRNAMGYMDGRAASVFKKGFTGGFPRIENLRAGKLLTALYLTGGAAATPKDPLWKYHWVRENEPERFARAHKWLDVRDYLALKCTDRVSMTRDSAHLTFLYDTRPGHLGWSGLLCRLFDVNPDHLPDVREAADPSGDLTRDAARDLGLSPGIPVFGGGGDITLIPIGAGCLRRHDTHIYVGTSGWVVANVDRRMVDVKNFMASICGAVPGFYNYVAEQETSGLCLQWVRDHLALDDIGIYSLEDDPTLESDALYDLMNQKVGEIPPGSGDLIFTPWLHGNRAPREDAWARGMFFNIGLETGKRAMIRSVLEGIAFHKRWMLEAMETKLPYRERLCFVGGGAKSEVLCQIMADVTGRQIDVPRDPRNAGAAGAAVICGLGLGVIDSMDRAKHLIHMERSHRPDPGTKHTYDRLFHVFKALYARNRKLFQHLNER